jgi:hypothetical protein
VPNPTPTRNPVSTIPGLPLTLLQKMEAAQDSNIPVVMTSGSAVEYGGTEVEDIIRAALARVNVQGECVLHFHPDHPLVLESVLALMLHTLEMTGSSPILQASSHGALRFTCHNLFEMYTSKYYLFVPL